MSTILDIFPDYIVEGEIARFAPNTRCWIWNGPTGSRGYGIARFNKKRWMAHRLSFFLRTGKTPEMVCHTCDNKKCVNPQHLFHGNARINAADRIKWKAQLSLDEIALIRNSTEPSFILAKKWQLSIRQIETIRPMARYVANLCGKAVAYA